MKIKKTHYQIILGSFLIGLLAYIVIHQIGLGAAQADTMNAFNCTAVTQIPQAECEALVAFYISTDGDNWINRRRWLENPEPCSWRFVSCRSGHVSRIDMGLDANNLNGPLPEEIGDLIHIERLILPINNITAIPNTIGNLTDLTYLNLSENSIPYLPPTIGNLVNLTILDLSENTISEVPPSIGNLVGLTLLDLSKNAITYIPPTIGNLVNLTVLDLSKNAIPFIPNEIGNLSSLNEIGLHNNKLSYIPVEIVFLTNIRSLNLKNNNLVDLPPEIGNMTSLEELIVSENYLLTVPPELTQLHNLALLSLENNQLTSLPSEFAQFSGPISLNVANNQIKLLPEEFSQSTFKNLRAEWNQISSLPAKLTVEGFLDLSNNLITSLSDEFISSLINTRFYVHHNPLTGPLPLSFTDVENFDHFKFHATDWCIPDDEEITAWLDNIYRVFETGFYCDQPRTSIIGIVRDEYNNPIPNIEVALYYYIDTSKSMGEFLKSTMSNDQGEYAFTDLGIVPYTLEFADSGTDFLGTRVLNITHDYGSPVVIDVYLSADGPVILEADTNNNSIVQINDVRTHNIFILMPYDQIDDLVLTYHHNCSPHYPIPEHARYNNVQYPLEDIGNNSYRIVIPATDLITSAHIYIHSCSGVFGDFILYEPTGYVLDEITNEPIINAELTLYEFPAWNKRIGPNDSRPFTCDSNRSKIDGEPWTQPPITELSMLYNKRRYDMPPILTAIPNTNIQYSNNMGKYGWSFLPECWYIQVKADGYYPYVSPVFGMVYDKDQTHHDLYDFNLYLRPLSEPSPTPTPSLTPTVTPTPTFLATFLPLPTATSTTTPTFTPTPTSTPTRAPTLTPTATRTYLPTRTPSPTPSPIGYSIYLPIIMHR